MTHKRIRTRESWIQQAKYDTEHYDEILEQKLAELKEIRKRKKKEDEK